MSRLTRNRSAAKIKTPTVFRLVDGRVTTQPAPATQSRSTAPSSPVQPTLAPGQEEIRHRAYLRWEAAGSPPGDGVSFWIEAERELTGF